MLRALIILIISTVGLFSQTVKLRFDLLAVNDGLSQNMVTAIVQDSIGFMWFGTKDGLNRFDGYNFKVFRNEIDDSTSISDNFIKSLFVDSKGNLWVGTRNGLNLYDPSKESFLNFDLEKRAVKNKLNNVVSIKEGKNNQIWAAYNNSTFSKVTYDPSLNKWILSQRVQFDKDKISSELLDFTLDKNNDFWLAYEDGLWKAEVENLQFNNSRKISNHPSNSLLSKDQNVYVGSYGKILSFSLDHNENKFKTYNLFGNEGKYNSWVYSVNEIIVQNDSSFFIATASGLIDLNINTLETKSIQSIPNDISTLSSNNLLSLSLDKSKNLWIGTSGYGINKANIILSKFQYYSAQYENKPFSSILLIKEDALGNIWFTNMGSLLFRLDHNTGKVFPGEPYNEPKLFYDIYFFPDNYNLRAEAYSINKYDSKNQFIESYSLPRSEEKRAIFQRFISVDYDRAWIAASNSLLKFDFSEKKFKAIDYPLEGDFQVLNVFEGNSDDLWIATDAGLFYYNINNNLWKIYKSGKNLLSNERIKSFSYDPINPYKYIWLGTDGGGLNRLDLQTDQIKVYTTRDGLPNGVVYGILTDDFYNLWLSTNNGLSSFNPITEQFKNYNVYDGLQNNEFNSLSYHKASNGKLYFGGIQGITVFNPGDLKSNEVKPPLYITEFRIFNNVISYKSEKSPIKNVIGFTNSIELSHDQNNISFSFAALDFTAPKNNKYKYRLEGFDEEWIDNGTSREAYYTNIPPGEYTFTVIGSNNDEIWNENGESLSIIIKTPFWQTWWAYFIYLFIALYTIYLVFRYQKNKLILAQQIELNMVEKQKFVELDRLKSRFLTNITHEFRTPLTLIIGPLQDLKKKLNDNNADNIIESVLRNSKHLLRLVNQLLDLAKLDKESLPVNRTENEIVTFIKENISMFHSLASQKGLQINFYSSHKEIFALFDSDILQKIITNLITNSIKYTPYEGTINIYLEYFEDNSAIEIKFEDNGVGIQADELKNIFNPFFRSSSSKVFNSDGYGIGLSLTKELIDILGGKITAESEPNIKTIFKLKIPMEIKSSAEGEIKLEYAEKEHISLLNSTINNLNNEFAVDDKIVLVIDDISEMRNYITGIIEEDYKVITAVDGIDGFEKAIESIPDLIISDVMMPGQSGFDLLHKLKINEVTSHIPVILLTAKGDENSKLTGLDIGADDYMVKPFSSSELKVRVKNLIKSRLLLKDKYAGDNLNIVEEKPKSTDELFLEKVSSLIYEKIENENLTIEEIAEAMNLSYSQLYRKIKSITNLTAVQFILKSRLMKAAEYLKNESYNISEIAFKVGIQNPSYFTQAFKKEYNCTPNEYIQKNKD